MTKIAPTNSQSLGFWTKHADIIDCLYESGDDELIASDDVLDQTLPPELSLLAKENREVISAIIQQGEDLVDWVDREIAAGLENIAARHCKIVSRGRMSNWGSKITIQHSDGRRARRLKEIVLGWGWFTHDNSLHVECWIWTRGGRNAERKACELLNAAGFNATPAQKLEGYESGTVRTGSVVVVTDESFKVDLQILVKQSLKCFSWITRARLERLFEVDDG